MHVLPLHFIVWQPATRSQLGPLALCTTGIAYTNASGHNNNNNYNKSERWVWG